MGNCSLRPILYRLLYFIYIFRLFWWVCENICMNSFICRDQRCNVCNCCAGITTRMIWMFMFAIHPVLVLLTWFRCWCWCWCSGKKKKKTQQSCSVVFRRTNSLTFVELKWRRQFSIFSFRKFIFIIILNISVLVKCELWMAIVRFFCFEFKCAPILMWCHCLVFLKRNKPTHYDEF